MRKWEEKYEKLKNGEFDSRIDELKLKIDEKKANREEYDEYQKLSKSKANVSKVANVLEYKEKLQQFLNSINEEIEIRSNMQKNDEESLKIEVELIQIEKELEEIAKILKDKDVSEDVKLELRNRKSELMGKIEDNNKKYVENQALLKEGLNRDQRLKKYDEKDLQKLKLEVSSRVSKCNMVAKSLVNGLSWDSIDLKLDNWGKLTNKGKKLSNKDKKTYELSDKKGKTEAPKGRESTEGQIKNNQEKQSEFANKHPRLAKIGNWFKKLFKKDNLLPEPEQIQKSDTPVEEKVTLDSDKVFKEYIKVVAEKGLDGIEADKKAAKQAAAKEKLAQMRAANRAAEAQKFGQDYADKSDFRTNNDGESR